MRGGVCIGILICICTCFVLEFCLNLYLSFSFNLYLNLYVYFLLYMYSQFQPLQSSWSTRFCEVQQDGDVESRPVLDTPHIRPPVQLFAFISLFAFVFLSA